MSVSFYREREFAPWQPGGTLTRPDETLIALAALAGGALIWAFANSRSARMGSAPVRANEATVRVVRGRKQSPESYAEDITRSLEFCEHLRAGGTESWRLYYRRLGWLRLAVAREVGPPPWRWPRVGVWPRRRGVHLVVGWRMTAFRLFVFVKGVG